MNKHHAEGGGLQSASQGHDYPLPPSHGEDDDPRKAMMPSSVMPGTSTPTGETLPDLDACQEQIGYQFNDLQYLVAALTHASGVSQRLASNERLEFLGDAILGMVVCKSLYDTYPNHSEGELTKIKSYVVSRDTCARISLQLGVDSFLILGKGMAADPDVPKSVLAAVFESLIAAIYLDGGMQHATDFILHSMQPEIESAIATEFGGNYKSLLQQFAQREHGVTPTYQLLDEQGPDHSKCFKISAQIGPHQFSAAWGKSKKESEQRAAHNAVSELRGDEAPYPSDEQPEPS
jgi:ribonuclease-3